MTDKKTRTGLDGLLNVISGFGTEKAKNPYSKLNGIDRIDRAELEDIYRCYWIAKAVDLRPWEMTREWRKFYCGSLSPTEIRKIEDYEFKINIQDNFKKALTWASLYGGCGLVIHVNGHGNMSEPLYPEKIKAGQLERLSVVDRWSLIEIKSVDYNPLSPNYRVAEHYHIAEDENKVPIHRSRIIFFRGREMPIRITRQLRGWGESDVQRWYSAIVNSETLVSAIVEAVHQSNIDVMSVEGLAELLSSEDGDKIAYERFEVQNLCRSLLNMTVIDAEDKFTRHPFQFAGLSQLHDSMLETLAAVTDIPVTKLLGYSAKGLNATGEGDRINFYDSIKSEQNNKLRHRLAVIDEILVRSAIGYMPDNLTFDFNPLERQSSTDKAKTNNDIADCLLKLKSLGADNKSLLKDAIEMGLLKNMTSEDVDKMNEMEQNKDENSDENSRDSNFDSSVNKKSNY